MSASVTQGAIMTRYRYNKTHKLYKTIVDSMLRTRCAVCTPVTCVPGRWAASLALRIFQISICECLAYWMIPSAAWRYWRLFADGPRFSLNCTYFFNLSPINGELMSLLSSIHRCIFVSTVSAATCTVTMVTYKRYVSGPVAYSCH